MHNLGKMNVLYQQVEGHATIINENDSNSKETS